MNVIYFDSSPMWKVPKLRKRISLRVRFIRKDNIPPNGMGGYSKYLWPFAGFSMTLIR